MTEIVCNTNFEIIQFENKNNNYVLNAKLIFTKKFINFQMKFTLQTVTRSKYTHTHTHTYIYIYTQQIQDSWAETDENTDF